MATDALLCTDVLDTGLSVVPLVRRLLGNIAVYSQQQRDERCEGRGFHKMEKTRFWFQ